LGQFCLDNLRSPWTIVLHSVLETLKNFHKYNTCHIHIMCMFQKYVSLWTSCQYIIYMYIFIWLNTFLHRNMKSLYIILSYYSSQLKLEVIWEESGEEKGVKSKWLLIPQKEVAAWRNKQDSHSLCSPNLSLVGC
jgi:hypothetical protein